MLPGGCASSACHPKLVELLHAMLHDGSCHEACLACHKAGPGGKRRATETSKASALLSMSNAMASAYQQRLGYKPQSEPQWPLYTSLLTHIKVGPEVLQQVLASLSASLAGVWRAPAAVASLQQQQQEEEEEEVSTEACAQLPSEEQSTAPCLAVMQSPATAQPQPQPSPSPAAHLAGPDGDDLSPAPGPTDPGPFSIGARSVQLWTTAPAQSDQHLHGSVTGGSSLTLSDLAEYGSMSSMECMGDGELHGELWEPVATALVSARQGTCCSQAKQQPGSANTASELPHDLHFTAGHHGVANAPRAVTTGQLALPDLPVAPPRCALSPKALNTTSTRNTVDIKSNCRAAVKCTGAVPTAFTASSTATGLRPAGGRRSLDAVQTTWVRRYGMGSTTPLHSNFAAKSPFAAASKSSPTACWHQHGLIDHFEAELRPHGGNPGSRLDGAVDNGQQTGCYSHSSSSLHPGLTTSRSWPAPAGPEECDECEQSAAGPRLQVQLPPLWLRNFKRTHLPVPLSALPSVLLDDEFMHIPEDDLPEEILAQLRSCSTPSSTATASSLSDAELSSGASSASCRSSLSGTSGTGSWLSSGLAAAKRTSSNASAVAFKCVQGAAGLLGNTASGAASLMRQVSGQKPTSVLASAAQGPAAAAEPGASGDALGGMPLATGMGMGRTSCGVGLAIESQQPHPVLCVYDFL